MGNSKKHTPKAKEPIKLRFKPIAGTEKEVKEAKKKGKEYPIEKGTWSIYLDYYNNGKREYEFLKLYLVPENTPIDKTTNTQTLELANAVKAQKIVELQNTAHGFNFSNIKQKARLIDYLQAIAAEKKQAVGNRTKGQHQTYNALIKRIKQYSGEQTTFKQITKEYCSGFIEFLKTAENCNYKKGISEIFTSGLLSENSKYMYIKTLNIALNRAVRDGILIQNPLILIPRQERPKRKLESREYLTIDEVKQLVKTPCTKPTVKNAFLFCCFSGLRFSDVKALTWGQLQTDNEGKTIIRFTQQKTDKPEYLQLSDEALKFLPERNEVKNSDVIFILSNNGYTNEALKGWVLAAGITKRVTFHVGRHTNATLLLSLGVPIETVSKLLGHSDIQTTQIYAKVIDKNKRAAVDKLDGLTD